MSKGPNLRQSQSPSIVERVEERSETDVEAGALILAPLEVLSPFFGPAGVMTAIAVAVFRGGSSVWLSRRAQKRVEAFLSQLRTNVDPRFDEFERRLRDIEAAEDLAARATRAAATASDDSQARALANVMAKGVLGDAGDGKASELMIAVLDGMTTSEMVGLRKLAESAPSGAKKVSTSAVSVVSEGSSALEPLAEAVVSRLVARDLLLVDPPGFGGFSLSSLGNQAVAALDDAKGASA